MPLKEQTNKAQEKQQNQSANKQTNIEITKQTNHHRNTIETKHHKNKQTTEPPQKLEHRKITNKDIWGQGYAPTCYFNFNCVLNIFYTCACDVHFQHLFVCLFVSVCLYFELNGLDAFLMIEFIIKIYRPGLQ